MATCRLKGWKVSHSGIVVARIPYKAVHPGQRLWAARLRVWV